MSSRMPRMIGDGRPAPAPAIQRSSFDFNAGDRSGLPWSHASAIRNRVAAASPARTGSFALVNESGKPSNLFNEHRGMNLRSYRLRSATMNPINGRIRQQAVPHTGKHG